MSHYARKILDSQTAEVFFESLAFVAVHFLHAWLTLGEKIKVFRAERR